LSQAVEYIETPYWRMSSPTTVPNHRKICVPTIHPVGDQRILRCAQVALDAGYDIHYVWLSDTPGTAAPHPQVAETRLKPGQSRAPRISQFLHVVKTAWAVDADLWHIHDFYMLLPAFVWCVVKNKRAVYDVHEYYPEYYSARLRGPTWIKKPAARAIAWTEQRLARCLGGANTVSEALENRLRGRGVEAISTPNFPAMQNYQDAARRLVPKLLTRVVHTGMLTREYGADILLEIARQLRHTAPDVEIIVFLRFPSKRLESAFHEAVDSCGKPANMQLMRPMPVHSLANFLSTCGIGLSVLQDQGQTPLAVPTKLYEYTAAALAIVSSDLPASRKFCEENSVAKLVAPAEPQEYCQAIVDLVEQADIVCDEVNRLAKQARASLSWEATCAPRLASLLRAIDIKATA
jgi:glycosyltransferase involved in cell wall biosynthesis